jgi:dipeptidyl aminopeptidase/acylaminoacyl peptidase
VAAVAAFGLIATAAAKPPPVPERVEKLMKALLGSPVFEGIALSPAGTYLAFIREESGHKVLATIDLRTKEIHGVSGSWKQDVVAFYWCGPETLLFQVGLDKVNHYQGLWLSDPRFDHVRRVPVKGKVLVTYEVRPSFVFLKDASPPKLSIDDEPFSALYRLYPEENRVELAEENPGRVVDWLADNAGRVRFAIRLLHEGNSELLERSADGASWKEIPFVKSPMPLSLDQSGSFLLLRYVGDNGLMRVGTFNLKSHRFEDRELSDPQYDINPNVLDDPKTGVPIGLFYDTGRPAALWLDKGYAGVQASLTAAFPDAEPRPWGVTYDGRILFGLAGDKRPPTLCLLSLKDRKASPLLPKFPDAVGFPWASMRDVAFRSRDNHVVHAYITLPPSRKNGQRVPLIALSHGGPFLRDTWGFEPNVQFFAALGYGVLQVNYRGSSGFGKEYALNDIIEVNRRAVDDVADGLEWAVGEGYADPRRLIVMGGSYGGYISLAIATRYPEVPAAVVGFAGVYDWYEQMKVDRDELSTIVDWRGRYYPDLKAHAAEYREVSPVNSADKVRAPVLLIHGGDDRRVEFEQSMAMVKALRRAGKPVQLVSNVASIHGLPDQESRLGYYQTVAAFLLEHVPSDAAP